MPGIVGLITRMPREQAERELSRMVEKLHHENFYVTGAWVEESLGVYVGWIARKDSFSDGMPLRSERGDVVLVIVGQLTLAAIFGDGQKFFDAARPHVGVKNNFAVDVACGAARGLNQARRAA